MLRANGVATACSLLLLLFVSSGHGSQTAKSPLREPLNQQVSNYEDSGHDLPITVDHLMQRYTVSWGMDLEASLKSGLISVHISRGTVADVLNAIMAQESNYKWVEINGVVNVIPKQNMNSILDVKIALFHVRDANGFDIHRVIVSLPEVKRWLGQNHLAERTPTVVDVLVGRNGAALSKISLELQRVTLRQILNKIVRSPGFRSWTVGRWGAKNQYLSIGVS